MWNQIARPSAVLPTCLCAVAILASCSTDMPTGAEEEQISLNQVNDARLSVCHRSGSAGVVTDIFMGELAAHVRSGDYVTRLVVTHKSGRANDGIHFHRIGDAIAFARAGRVARGELRSAACRITIAVDTGVFQGSSIASADRSLENFPLVVDVPDITLHGALVMKLDAYRRATGTSATQRETTLALESQPDVDNGLVPIILANGHPGGSAGNGLTVEGFALQSGNSHGFAVFGIRVRGLAIRGNRFEEGFDITMDLRQSSAIIARNQISGSFLCDMCLAGPGDFTVTGNRLLVGALEGILTTPVIDASFLPSDVEPSILPAAAELSADISNNEVRDHRGLPAGAAIRIGAVGLGGPDVRGSSHIAIRDNLLVNNNFALMVEGAYPVLGTRLRGDIDVTLGDNVLRRSCQADLLVAFARHTTGLGLVDGSYLRNSTYRLTLHGNLPFREAWFSNPPGLGNTLLVNGRQVANGTRQFYDAASCPARAAARRDIAMSNARAR